MNPGRVTRSAIVAGIVAVDAGDRVVDELARLHVRHRVHLAEAGLEVAVPELLVRDVDRAVALHARPRLLHDRLALREGLILEHVRVAALLAEVDAERVARPHRLEPRILLDLLLRDDRARVRLVRRAGKRLRAAVLGPDLVYGLPVGLVLERVLLPPYRRIRRVVGDLLAGPRAAPSRPASPSRRASWPSRVRLGERRYRSAPSRASRRRRAARRRRGRSRRGGWWRCAVGHCPVLPGGAAKRRAQCGRRPRRCAFERALAREACRRRPARAPTRYR